MSKPVSKTDSMYKFWRDDNPSRNHTNRKPRVARWIKNQMTRAKRRFYARLDAKKPQSLD